ncbi:MAG: GNAT family N-acetyltransferase [Roseburia sp.]|nr:GNAT family N-acetyltransferase [Roseburia sp.]
MIKSERTNIVPFDMNYLNHYFNGFNAKITRFQWPDPFESIEDAKTVLQEFLNEMERGETLLFSILSKNGDFLGSVEIHGLSEDCPELGIWIIESEQNKGYAYEALDAVLDYLCSKYDKAKFYYEADIRNIGSIKLLQKFDKKYEILEQGVEKFTTDSGKKLELRGYILRK